MRLNASEQIAYRQDDVGDDGDPKGVGADDRDSHECSDDSQNGQNHRDDEHRGGRRRQIHLQPSLFVDLRTVIAFSRKSRGFTLQALEANLRLTIAERAAKEEAG